MFRISECPFLSTGEVLLVLRDLVRRNILTEAVVPDATEVRQSASCRPPIERALLVARFVSDELLCSFIASLVPDLNKYKASRAFLGCDAVSRLYHVARRYLAIGKFHRRNTKEYTRYVLWGIACPSNCSRDRLGVEHSQSIEISAGRCRLVVDSLTTSAEGVGQFWAGRK